MSIYTEKFKYFLKKNQLKYTTERKKVIEIVEALKEHFDAEEIYQRSIKDQSNVSLATVYRTIPLLVQSGLIKEALRNREKVEYEKIYKKKKHDHLVCLCCGKVIEFYSENVVKLQEEVCNDIHFYPIEHHIEIKGYCEKCQKIIEIDKEKTGKNS